MTGIMSRIRARGAQLSAMEWELYQTISCPAPVAWAVLGWGGRRAGRGLVRRGLARSEDGWLRHVPTSSRKEAR